MLKVLFIPTLAIFLSGATVSKAAIIMEIIADNDFAMLVGGNSSISRLLYQNNVVWNQQVAQASSFNISLLPGENYFYLLGLGGGGTEDIGGKVNGVALNTISVERSTNIASYLTGYFSQLGTPAAGRIQNIEDGTFSVMLADVQTALPNVTWGAPVTKVSGVGSIPTGVAFSFPTTNAMLFRFSASSVGVSASAVPEPSQIAASLLVLGLIAGGFYSRSLKARKLT